MSFLLLCHGIQMIKGLRSSLTHEERKNIVVLSIGRENTQVRVTDSILFLVYNVYRHPDFLKNLCEHVRTKGTSVQNARPDSAIGVFLDLYHKDLQKNPDQMLRLYSEKDRIQNLCLKSNFVNERVMAKVSVSPGDNHLYVAKNPRRSPDREGTIPRGIHLAATDKTSLPPYAYYDQRSRDLYVDLGLGLYRCDKSGEMTSVLSMSQTRSVSLETVCSRIHNENRGTNYLLLIACRGYAFPAYGNPFQSERGNLKRPRQQDRNKDLPPNKKKKQK
jgi:hypothetical protein